MSGENTGLKGSDFQGVVPQFAEAFALRREADGRLVFHGTIQGCHVWVQPESRSMMTNRDAAKPGDAAGTLNYGLEMGQLKAHAGALETNDATFGSMFGASSRVPLPDSAPTCGTGGYTTPALIVAVAVVVAAVTLRLKRPSA